MDTAGRLTGIGGSDAAAVLGLNPYKSPLDVWLEKTGRAAPVDLSANERVLWGTLLEAIAAKEYGRRTGLKIRRCNAMLRHRDYPWMIAHLDRRVEGGRILEVKTTGAHNAGQWGDPGTDQVPETYLCQCQHYLAVTGSHRCDLAVLIGGQDFRIYCLGRDDELIGAMIEREREFWRCVEEEIAPPPRSAADIERMFPADDGKEVFATDAVFAAARELSDLRREMKGLREREEQLSKTVKAALGAATTLLSPTGEPLFEWRKTTTSRVLREVGARRKNGQP